ncbi:hypothetical protein SNOG_11108 [Parastagonospora nodorum SN15]|uniref:Uncharacterized protein n=1 Tax=Phaeosphaeria nodorum (strain SN15 / ATCC MYA-4574 / FGSC 10173) TaxID=321614 RepID=Q0UAV6_PHANO|nr:hypothetical protein SNOG_11108 [Parastagonospora nodorum SN15]EAT81607.1 hypothetical protein SNOG_11108 [Parastagonospora nodorum SN15]
MEQPGPLARPLLSASGNRTERSVQLTHASWVAAFGAVVTIMASLTGFFTQQLVQFQDCLQKDTTALVKISRTNSYVKHGAWI